MPLNCPRLLLLLAPLAFAAPAQGGEKPAFAAPGAWMVPATLPPNQAATPVGALNILLDDRQLHLTPQSDDLYLESAIRIQNPQGLQAMGTISVAWDPDLDSVTIHKLHIIRGAQVIDVLATGQTFTVLRRETNLEGAALDGTLTAAIQPGGLQTGDVIDFAYTISNTDPVFQGISEWRLVATSTLPVSRLRMRASWPSNVPIHWQPSAAIAGLKQVSDGGVQSVTYSTENAAPLTPVNGAPARYLRERRIDFTQFGSWAAMSKHFAPLYVKAATLIPRSALLDQIAHIRATYAKPQDRAGAALALVQDQVRYVFLGMNDGGLVPAGADLTWARRFGDCKGKTVLLLALLRGLDIEADPVVVNAFGGDGLNTRLPLMSDFDHVLVRATIEGHAYWLDGTRTGDRRIADIAVPAFLWGLPLTANGSDLVPITPHPLSDPSEAEAIRIDASAGIYAPAPFHAEVVLRGDAASNLRLRMANIPAQQLDQDLRSYWTRRYGFVDIKSVSAAFDEAAGVERVTMDGTAAVQWVDRAIRTQNLALGAGRAPDFNRAPDTDHEAPFAVPFPFYLRNAETIVLPNGGAGYTVQGQDVDRIAGGVEYKRTANIYHGIFVGEASARALAPEFPAAEAQATAAALRDLVQSVVYIEMPPRYVFSKQDLAAMRGKTLTSADQYIARGSTMLDHLQFDQALADFTAAIALDKKSVRAIADRGLTYAWKGDEKHARQDMAAASALEPDNPVVLRTSGLLALGAGHEQDAIDAFTQLLVHDPNNSFALMRRASAYVQAGDDDKALADTVTLMRLQPDFYGAHILRAGIFRRRGAVDQAAAEASAIVAMASANVQAYVAAADIYADLHRTADTMHAFDRALAIHPTVVTYLARAKIRDAQDAVGRRADIDAALKLEPHTKAALTALAKLQSGAGDHAAATGTLSSALADQPNDPELLTLRGIEYLKSNRQSEAGKDFAAAKTFALTPGDNNNICWLKATAGVALDAALQDCNAALAEKPGQTSFLDSKGLVLLRLARYGDAVDIYSKALQLHRVAPTSLFGRSIAERRQGHAKAAADDLAAARTADPGIDRQFAEFGLMP